MSGVSGGELARRAYEQAWLFGTEFVYGNEATELRIDGGDRIVTWQTAVCSPRGRWCWRWGSRIGGWDRDAGGADLRGSVLRRWVTAAEAMTDERVFVVGGGNSAGRPPCTWRGARST